MKTILVGRSPENHIVVEDVLVSGKHLQIIHNEAGYFVEDLHSTNGTWIDDTLLRGGRQAITLNTIIKVGETILIWRQHFTESAFEPPQSLPEPSQIQPVDVLPALPTTPKIRFWTIFSWFLIGTGALFIILLLFWYFNFVQKP
jgi:pSer/pThr/pTyr-binding forkhead associated (FHA) protein